MLQERHENVTGAAQMLQERHKCCRSGTNATGAAPQSELHLRGGIGGMYSSRGGISRYGSVGSYSLKGSGGGGLLTRLTRMGDTG